MKMTMPTLFLLCFVFAFTGTHSFAQTKTLTIQLAESADRSEKIEFQLNNNGQDTSFYAVSLQAYFNDEWKEVAPDVLNNLPNKAISVRALAPGKKEPQVYYFSHLDARIRNTADKLRFKVSYGPSSDQLDKFNVSETFK